MQGSWYCCSVDSILNSIKCGYCQFAVVVHKQILYIEGCAQWIPFCGDVQDWVGSSELSVFLCLISSPSRCSLIGSLSIGHGLIILQMTLLTFFYIHCSSICTDIFGSDGLLTQWLHHFSQQHTNSTLVKFPLLGWHRQKMCRYSVTAECKSLLPHSHSHSLNILFLCPLLSCWPSPSKRQTLCSSLCLLRWIINQFSPWQCFSCDTLHSLG